MDRLPDSTNPPPQQPAPVLADLLAELVEFRRQRNIALRRNPHTLPPPASPAASPAAAPAAAPMSLPSQPSSTIPSPSPSSPSSSSSSPSCPLCRAGASVRRAASLNPPDPSTISIPRLRVSVFKRSILARTRTRSIRHDSDLPMTDTPDSRSPSLLSRSSLPIRKQRRFAIVSRQRTTTARISHSATLTPLRPSRYALCPSHASLRRSLANFAADRNANALLRTLRTRRASHHLAGLLLLRNSARLHHNNHIPANSQTLPDIDNHLNNHQDLAMRQLENSLDRMGLADDAAASSSVQKDPPASS